VKKTSEATGDKENMTEKGCTLALKPVLKRDLLIICHSGRDEKGSISSG